MPREKNKPEKLVHLNDFWSSTKIPTPIYLMS